MTALLINACTDWECPACGRTDRTPGIMPPNATRFHTCPALHMLTAPMVRAGTDCKITAVERGDYLNGDQQRTGDDGKPYMAVMTTHADGHTDAAVFPAVATLAASTGGRA